MAISPLSPLGGLDQRTAAMLVDLQFRRQFFLVHTLFISTIGKCLLVIIRVYKTLPLRANLLLPSHHDVTCSRLSVLTSFWHQRVLNCARMTMFYLATIWLLFGVLVCFRHRRALAVHLCHLRSEHSGNVQIKRNPHYHVHVRRFTVKYLTNW